MEKAKFAYYPLGKAFEKQTGWCFKKDELKQIEFTFSQRLVNDLIRVKLKEIFNLRDVIKKDDESCK